MVQTTLHVCSACFHMFCITRVLWVSIFRHLAQAGYFTALLWMKLSFVQSYYNLYVYKFNSCIHAKYLYFYFICVFDSDLCILRSAKLRQWYCCALRWLCWAVQCNVLDSNLTDNLKRQHNIYIYVYIYIYIYIYI